MVVAMFEQNKQVAYKGPIMRFLKSAYIQICKSHEQRKNGPESGKTQKEIFAKSKVHRSSITPASKMIQALSHGK